MMEERQGWGEPEDDDTAEERGLRYLSQLIKWSDAQPRRRCKGER